MEILYNTSQSNLDKGGKRWYLYEKYLGETGLWGNLWSPNPHDIWGTVTTVEILQFSSKSAGKIVGSPHLTVPHLSLWKAVTRILSRGPCIVLRLCKWGVSTNLRSCRNY